MNLRDELIEALIAEHIPSPRLEADIILRHAAPNYPDISEMELKKVREILSRRVNHEPLDKIFGLREFYKYTFQVNQNVLSPRPETEILVEKALEMIPKNSPCEILDMGTGSGCILLSLLKERPLSHGVGVDISPSALDVAAKNANLLGVEKQVRWINSSWTTAQLPYDTFDVIVSNPPYIETSEIPTLSPEVKNYDPLSALDGGEDGLFCYREIAKLVPLLLKKEGYIFLEVGINQAESVNHIFKMAGLKPVEIVSDLAGINRCVILKK